MKLKYLAIVLSLFATSAMAEPACWPKPVPYGTGYGMVTSSGLGENHELGEWGYWFCPDPYEIRWEIGYRRWDYHMKFPSDQGLSALNYVKQTWTMNATTPPTDPAVKPLYDAARAHLEMNKPHVPRYVVAKNGTSTTRPMRLRTTDGKLGATVTERATVGDECTCFDPNRRVRSGTSSYCDPRTGDFDIARTLVTLCSRVKE